jgi:copper transporter 1
MNPNSRQLTILTLLLLASIALAHGGEGRTGSNIINDSTTTPTSQVNLGSEMMMTPYFHWMANADALYFKAWVPRTPGALAGACISLFFLAMFERFLGAAKGLLEAWWRRR